MENVIVAVFDVESEAYQAYSEISKTRAGTGYYVAEAALLKNEDGAVKLIDGFTAPAEGDDTAAGIVIGSLVGILGGPLGVMLGASYGALAGSALDMADAADSLSAFAVMAAKTFAGETAIIALVEEEEPAFDAALSNYRTAIARYDAVDIADDVDRAYELQADLTHQAIAEMRADRKAERTARREERAAKIQAGMDAAADKLDATSEKINDKLEEASDKLNARIDEAEAKIKDALAE